MNFVDARIDGGALVSRDGVNMPVPPSMNGWVRTGAEVRVGIRPENVHPAPSDAPRTARVVAEVSLREPLGHETLTHLRFGSVEWVARGTREFSPGPDGQTPVFLDLDRMHIFWKDSGRRVAWPTSPPVPPKPLDDPSYPPAK
jgi:multiple sugar transport system ATP-binding protein